MRTKEALKLSLPALVARLGTLPGVTRVEEADRARLAELLRPWLGDAGLDPDLPMPVLRGLPLRPGVRRTRA